MTTAPGARRGPREAARLAVLPRVGSVACLVLLALLGAVASASPAAAHATLVATDPVEGEVLASTPDLVTFTFDEPVSLTSDAVQVFDATGAPVESTSASRDRVITTDLPDALDDGTYVVVWKAVSADGHPIAGSLSFSIGTASPSVAAPAVPEVRVEPARSLLSAVHAIGYVGLLTAGGLVLSLCWTSAGVRLDPRVRRRVRRWLVGAAATSVVAGVVALPLAGAYQQGVVPSDLSAALDLALLRDALTALALQVAGLAVAIALLSRRGVALTAAGLAVVSPALVGHSRATDPVWLVLSTDALHLLAGAAWLGGLLALALTLPSLSGRPRDAAVVLTRFSSVAAGLLVVLALTGTLMGWRILGGWTPLLDTAYGRLLLVKVALAGLVVLVAGWNRWRLLPRVSADLGHTGQRAAVASVARVVRVESALLVVLLGVTGFLVNRSPLEQEPERGVVASRVEVGVLGESRVLGTLTPGRSGPNTITVQVQGPGGEPRDGFSAPVVSVRSEGASADTTIDLGSQPVRPTAVGTYVADVVLPAPGTWVVQVSLRVSEFDNPVTTIRFEVE